MRSYTTFPEARNRAKNRYVRNATSIRPGIRSLVDKKKPNLTEVTRWIGSMIQL